MCLCKFVNVLKIARTMRCYLTNEIKLILMQFRLPALIYSDVLRSPLITSPKNRPFKKMVPSDPFVAIACDFVASEWAFCLSQRDRAFFCRVTVQNGQTEHLLRRGPRYFATTEVRCIHLVAKTPLNSSPWISKSKNDCFALKCNLLMDRTIFIWSVPSSSDSSMSVNLTGAQPKLYLAVWPQQLLPNPQRAMCVNGGALMWKLFICYDTENIHKYHNNILYLLLGPFFFFSFSISGATAAWCGVISERFPGNLLLFKKRFKK